MKDTFSKNSKEYAKFRHKYPEALFSFCESQIEERGAAWDSGTGNGQVTGELA